MSQNPHKRKGEKPLYPPAGLDHKTPPLVYPATYLRKSLCPSSPTTPPRPFPGNIALSPGRATASRGRPCVDHPLEKGKVKRVNTLGLVDTIITSALWWQERDATAPLSNRRASVHRTFHQRDAGLTCVADKPNPKAHTGPSQTLKNPPPQQNALVYELLCVVSVNVFSYLEFWDKYE